MDSTILYVIIAVLATAVCMPAIKAIIDKAKGDKPAPAPAGSAVDEAAKQGDTKPAASTKSLARAIISGWRRKSALVVIAAFMLFVAPWVLQWLPDSGGKTTIVQFCHAVGGMTLLYALVEQLVRMMLPYRNADGSDMKTEQFIHAAMGGNVAAAMVFASHIVLRVGLMFVFGSLYLAAILPR